MHTLIIEKARINDNVLDSLHPSVVQRVDYVFEYPARLPAILGVGFLIAQ
jgi:hypothetical protein